MKRLRRILLTVLLSLLGLVVLAVVGLQLFLNSSLADRVVQKYAAEFIDADVSYSRLSASLFRGFPFVGIDIDSLCVTYPHSRYASWQKPGQPALRYAGSGAEVDTLAALRSLRVNANPWPLLHSRLEVGGVSLGGLRLYAHSYCDSVRNFNVFKPSGKERDTTKNGSTFSILPVPLALEGVAVYTGSIGDFLVPVDVTGKVGVDITPDGTALDVRSFDGRLAYLPLSLKGTLGFYPDSTAVDASLRVVSCPVDTVLQDYVAEFTDVVCDWRTDARMSLDVKACGAFAHGRFPKAEGSVSIPECNVYYAPLRLPARLALEADADMTEKRLLDVDVNLLRAKTKGAALDADGRLGDVLGGDPAIRLAAIGYAVADSVMALLFSDLPAKAEGRLNLALDADARVSQINALKFRDAKLKARIDGDRLRFTMPADTLEAQMFCPKILLSSNSDCIDVGLDIDSVRFDKGAALRARVRNMQNKGRLFKVATPAGDAPRLEFDSDAERLFLKTGVHRIGASTATVRASVQKRIRNANSRRHRQMDSLHRLYPDATRAELAHKLRPSGRQLAEDDFAKADVDISLDSTLRAYLREWTPYGKVSLGGGFFASPVLPLRTRLSAFTGEFDGNALTLDTLSVKCGTSDVSASGVLSGLRRSLQRKGDLKLDLALRSDRINVNEIVAAFQKGSDTIVPENLAENDESFVVDSIATSGIDSSAFALIIVPGNVDLALGLEAARVDYSDFSVRPLQTSLKIKDRTLQLTDTHLSTPMGKIGLDAYYATKSKQDISAGVDLKLIDVSAQEVIQILPVVDSLIPALKSFEGNLGVEVSATTQLDTNMNVLIPTVDGVVRIKGRDLMIRDAGQLRKLTRLLLFKDKNIGHIDDLNVNAVVHDSKVEVFPFELGVDRYKLALRGMQGLDKTMYYHVSILKTPFLIPFGINLFGTWDNWRFIIGFPKYREGKVQSFSTQIDTMQINIAKSIRDIYSLGVAKVKAHNESSRVKLEKSVGADNLAAIQDLQMLSDEDFAALDEMQFDFQMAEMEQELYEEVEAVLEESYSDIERLMKNYEEMTYDATTKKWMNRLKEQSDRKKAKKNQ